MMLAMMAILLTTVRAMDLPTCQRQLLSQGRELLDTEHQHLETKKQLLDAEEKLLEMKRQPQHTDEMCERKAKELAHWSSWEYEGKEEWTVYT